MASIDINIGSSADDGTGDNLRTFATNVAAMFAEIYGLGTAESDLTTGTAFEITNARIATNAAIDMDKLDGDSLAGSLTDFAQDDLVILSDTSDSGNLKNMTTSNLEDSIFGNVSGDATIAAGGALTIANDSVEHSMLENRYTAQVDVTSSNSISIDWSAGAVFKLSGALTGTTTITFSNFQIGQCIEICNLQGSVTVNLACVNGGVQDYFYKVGGDYDGSSANLLQVVCLENDGSDKSFAYSVNSYADDSSI
tara:strand:- start:1497 stop:2255 length:759 start_codon:yes stop_codon:yes gene_type:complete